MSFAAPGFLAALLLVPLVVAAYVGRERGERRTRAAFAAPGVLPSVTPVRPGWRRHVAPALLALAVAILAIALARPERTVAVPVQRATVMLLVDRSGSMAATDVAPSRLAAVRAAAQTFLAKVPAGVRVGLIVFNHTVQLSEPATTDRASVRAALAATTPAGSTATGDALELALHSVTRPAAIVLLSDGKSVRGRDPIAVAHEARNARIPVYTVALGTSAGLVKGSPVPPDPQTLEQIAQISGGLAYTAQDAGTLSDVYRRLGSSVATAHRKHELTAGFAGGALVALGLAAATSLLWFRRIL